MSRIFKAAAVLGILGPMPGYLVYTFTGSGHFVFGGWAQTLLVLAWYPSAVLMFGPFCLGAGLLGLCVIRLAQESPHRWLKPALILSLPILAGVPICMLGFPEFAIPSSIFWSIALFLNREHLYDPEPSPGFHKAYKWLTQLKP